MRFRFPVFRSVPSFGHHIRAGDRAMLASEWATARQEYGIVLARRSDNIAIWVQYGHAAKELGDIEDAERAYAKARELAPDDLDIQFHHARALIANDRRSDAMASLADILRRAPDHREAYAAIVHHGGRNHLPDGFQHVALRSTQRHVADELDRTVDALRAWADAGTYPVSTYAAFRRDFPLRPPPGQDDAIFTIIVDGRDASPYFVRATLLSLVDQTRVGWRALVIASPDLIAHPVASLDAADDRISFAPSFAPAPGLLIHLTAGTILDSYALDWFAFVAQRTGCAAAWCDEDRAAEPWQGRRIHSDPILWGVFDADLIAQTRTPPAVILLRNGDIAALSNNDDPAEARRDALLSAGRRGTVAHIPRLLASVLRIPPRSEIAPAEGEPIRRWVSDPNGAPPRPGPVGSLPDRVIVARGPRPAVSTPATASRGASIDVIIPTRDAPELLEKAVDSLRRHAAQAARLRLTIVDNRSEQIETARLLERLSRSGIARVLPLDEPFNWSRANNVAAADSVADILVFANNDIEMLSPGWDNLVEAWLDDPSIGAIGARLLYPDGTLQHGGMVFGTGEGSPRHEAVHAESGDVGPLERYDLVHRTSAVTGAFLGVKRSSFDRVGGFDAVRFAIGYNDIDFCLKLRSIGLDVLYIPTIEAIHHESKTRGLNVGRAKVAWDQGEIRSLYERWGDGMIVDPAYNPYWSRDKLYDGFREPPVSEILRHIDLGARPQPWRLEQIGP